MMSDGRGEPLRSPCKRAIGNPQGRAHDAYRLIAEGNIVMIVRAYDGLDIAERDRHARVMSMAQNILAKQHSMVADLDPVAVRKRSVDLALVRLDASVRAF
jgi:hypothetical protein